MVIMAGNLSIVLRQLSLSKTVGQLLERRGPSPRKAIQFQHSNYATDVTATAAPVAVKKETVSKAMKAYLERAQEHDKFMKAQTIDFQIGKRHLANMMGEDAETFTQEDVDRAIEYLFPSGIYDKKARPMMKPPEEIFPPRKAAEFDETGRPFHSMFYTSKPNFFKLLFDIVEEMNALYKFEERMNRKGQEPDPNLKLDLIGYEWMSKEKLEEHLVETIADIEYTNFVGAMERLLSLPFSYKAKDFIDKYRLPLVAQKTVDEIPKPNYDENGVAYVTTYECQRKTAWADVTVRSPGTGKITINGKDITYFDIVQSREQVIFPLLFTEKLGKVDVEATVTGGGPTSQAGAVRFGLARSLRSFVDEDMIEKMRLAGLLTRDPRKRERKKPGQEGARRKFTWKKR